ncbi:hypothetical protein H0H81_001508 [Sphagnurus paluster]|uniref:Uncharacterized protein n=1 Tax=Sphagnurus paluster TaxID=117069 RepID=A0A9P7KN66_9AGAR|nr:hypothetical protein H0H81_001508 [Sphagnurus paluster]
MGYIAMPIHLPPEEPRSLPLGADRSTYDLQEAHRQEDPEDVRDVYEPSDIAEERAYYRFGFQSPVIASETAPPTTSPSHPKTSWNFCREYLGNGRWLDAASQTSSDSMSPPPDADVQASMGTFFDFLLDSQKIDDIPGEIYDLTKPLDALAELVHLRSERIDGTKHYFLRPKNAPNVPFELVFTSAATVVEILRRRLWGLDFHRLVRKLLDRGMHFKTCVTGSSALSQQHLHLHSTITHQFPGLGYRPPNYKPDAADYAAYEHVRDMFLDSPKGRAALLHGGIISRLAKDVVHYQHVLERPMPNVIISNGPLVPVQSIGCWDDTLTEHEINLICGVYKVDTDRTQRASTSAQTTDVSWWPKPPAWAAAGLNVGYWSEDCERWFQTHLAKIREGQFQLRSPSAWKNGLRFNHSTARVTAKNEERAAEYLVRCNI